MVEFTCEQIGMDQAELQERVVSGLVNKVLGERDEDFPYNEVMKEANNLITEAVNAKVKAVADEFVLPRIEALIEGFCLQKTNQWGEKIREEMTFTEYLVKRAEDYLTEKVDYDGRTKAERGGFTWNPHQTRIANMIDGHLHYEISRAMKTAVDGAMESITEGLADTCKIKLAEIGKKLEVKVMTK